MSIDQRSFLSVFPQSDTSSLDIMSSPRMRRGTYTNQGLTIKDKAIQELKLRELIRFSQKLDSQKLDQQSIEILANALHGKATEEERKHKTFLGKGLKIIDIVSNGIKRRGFRTTAAKARQMSQRLLTSIEQLSSHSKMSIFPSPAASQLEVLSIKKSDLKQESSPIHQQVPSSLQIMTYVKGAIKTRELIPTQKMALGRGKFAKVYEHREISSLVVKKSKIAMEKEFEIGTQLCHPNLVKVHQLYIKETPEGNIYKLVMDKIPGKTLSCYYYQSEKLSFEVARQLISQAQDCCLYLFKQKVSWNDLNDGNLFAISHPSQDEWNLMITDFGAWSIMDDSPKRALYLLLGAMEAVGWIVKSSSFRANNKKNPEQEHPIIFPPKFFGEQIRLIQIVSCFGPYAHENRPWMQRIKEKMANMKEEEGLEALLKDYFDEVLKAFDEAREALH